MDLIKYIIEIQNKDLLKRIADDYFDEEDKQKFINKYDKSLMRYIPIKKRDEIICYKAKIHSKYLR